MSSRSKKVIGYSIPVEEYFSLFIQQILGTYSLPAYFGSPEYFTEQNKDLCSLLGHSRGWSDRGRDISSAIMEKNVLACGNFWKISSDSFFKIVKTDAWAVIIEGKSIIRCLRRGEGMK